MTRTTYGAEVSIKGRTEPLTFTFTPLESETDHMSAAYEHAARITGKPFEDIGMPYIQEVDA